MKSIKSKIIAVVLSFVALTSIAIGLLSYASSNKVVAQDSSQIMNLLCENKMNDFNAIFKRIKQSTETLASTVQLSITQIDELKNNPERLERITNSLLPLSINSARDSEFVIAVYIRYAPSFSVTDSGFFYVDENKDNHFVHHEPTNLALYEENDRERVAWFYEAKEAGKPIWLDPYYNKNIDVKVISYVIPIYVENEFIGVVGMDVDFKELEHIVSNTSVYDTGYAFLANDQAQIIYHGELDYGTDLLEFNNGEFKEMAAFLLRDAQNIQDELLGYSCRGIKKEATFRELENGMRFILSAPKSEINAQANQLLIQIIISVAIVVSIAAVLTFIFARKLTTPLLELSAAAKKIAGGDLSVSIAHHSNDEVGELAESFRQMVVQLDRHFKDINDLAYKDALTGVMNKLAYIEMEDRLNEAIRAKNANFSLVVFDLDNLKTINDTLGHDIGDQFIIAGSEVINKTFPDYPLYRIGGDEFVVLLENADYQANEALAESLKQHLNESKSISDHKLMVSYGIVHYDPKVDDYFNDVFKRADTAMYRYKEHRKQITINKKSIFFDVE